MHDGMRTILATFLVIMSLTACSVSGESTTAVSQSATGCISEPLNGGDSLMPKCGHADTEAYTYAAQHYTNYDAGDLTCDAMFYSCYLELWFGAGQEIVIACDTDENGGVHCTSN